MWRHINHSQKFNEFHIAAAQLYVSSACNCPDINFIGSILFLAPTIQLLQDDLLADDTNKFLQSAIACGRKIVVTELGKQMLRVQNSNANPITKQMMGATSATASNSMVSKNGDVKQKPVGILIANSTAPKVLAKPNIVKRFTPDEWTKLCGEGKIKTIATPNVIATANGAIR